MKRLTIAVATGLLGLGVAKAELQIDAQKKLLTLEGQTITKTVCTGKTMGGYYDNGKFVQEKPYSWSTLYTPKFVKASYCEKTDLALDTELFPCELGTADYMHFDQVGRVEVYDLVFNSEFPKGGPGEFKRFAGFISEDIRYEGKNGEDKPAIQAANDGDMSYDVIYPPADDTPGAKRENPTLKVMGVHGEDIPKRQTMKSSVECKTEWTKVVPKVESKTFEKSLLVLDGDRYYFMTETYGAVFLDYSNDAALAAKVEEKLNQGMPFYFTGKVVGGEAQGYELVLESMETAVKDGQPLVN